MWIFADGHTGDVQQPDSGQMLWILSEQLLKVFNGPARPGLLFVHAVAADRQNAAFAVVAEHTVFGLADPQIRECQLKQHVFGNGCGDLISQFRQQRQSLKQSLCRFLVGAQPQLVDAKLVTQQKPIKVTDTGQLQHGCIVSRPSITEIHVFVRRAHPDVVEDVKHPAVCVYRHGFDRCSRSVGCQSGMRLRLFRRRSCRRFRHLSGCCADRRLRIL